MGDDYQGLIARAVAKLPENTESAREAVYERARRILDTHLSGRSSEAEPDLKNEFARLEEAIKNVERENRILRGAARGLGRSDGAQQVGTAAEVPPDDRNTRFTDMKTNDLVRMYTYRLNPLPGEDYKTIESILKSRGVAVGMDDEAEPSSYSDPIDGNASQGTASVKTYWEVKAPDGSVKTYGNVADASDAIMAGKIKAEWLCRRVTTKISKKDAAPETSKWRTVEDSFDVYRPVARFMQRGALVGLLVGTTIAFAIKLADSTYAAFAIKYPTLYGAALTSAFLFFSSISPLVAEVLPTYKSDVTQLTVRINGVLVFIGLFLVVNLGTGVLLGVALGLGGLVLFFFVSILVGGFPGLVIGTCIGLIRRRSLPLPPRASPENGLRIISLGIILPVIGIVVGLYVFIAYVLPFAAERSVELLNSPVLRFGLK